MLLPITSRFLLEAFNPERPCWKPMVCGPCWREWGGSCCDRSVDRHDLAVVDAAKRSQFQRGLGAAAVDGLDLVARVGGAAHHGAAAGGRDAEVQAGVAAGLGHGPGEALQPLALG